MKWRNNIIQAQEGGATVYKKSSLHVFFLFLAKIIKSRVLRASGVYIYIYIKTNMK